MEYIGLDTQIRRNNRNSALLMIAFPLLLLGLLYVLLFLFHNARDEYSVHARFLQTFPFVLIAVGFWFLVAWTSHALLIRLATGAHPLERRDNKRVYNLVENLCIAQGMPVPAIYIIDDDSLNAFASGIDRKSYSITLSRGIIDKLDEAELEGVLAHELTHIRNRDVRLLIISIIFVGIFSFLAEVAFRSLRFSGGGRRSRSGKGSGPVVLIVIVITAVAYLLSLLLRFGISRNREYLADAGSAEMTKRPYALASALRKIAADPAIEAVESRDVAQLFIDNPTPSTRQSGSWDNLFSTHPPIEKRIALLDQYV